jgi:hypothetical protein
MGQARDGLEMPIAPVVPGSEKVFLYSRPEGGVSWKKETMRVWREADSTP